MNPWIPVIIGSGVIGQLLISVFYYGRLTQKVTDVTETVAEIKREKYGERIARLEALKNGAASGR